MALYPGTKKVVAVSANIASPGTTLLAEARKGYLMRAEWVRLLGSNAITITLGTQNDPAGGTTIGPDLLDTNGTAVNATADISPNKPKIFDDDLLLTISGVSGDTGYLVFYFDADFNRR